jgi:hypothetical protein
MCYIESMIKIFAFFLAMVLMTTASFSAAGHLSESELERVKAYKHLIKEIDPKSLNESITELEKSRYPQVQLQMKEAIAHAYVDIVQEQDVQGQKKKEWLYSMITLNMAYLQFMGREQGPTNAEPLNKLIRMKLRKYLSDEIWQKPGFKQSLG